MLSLSELVYQFLRMRRLIRNGVWAGILPILLFALSGCTDMVREELDETHARLTALQQLAGSVNRELTALGRIVSELDDSHTVVPGSLVEVEDGYEVSFRDGKKIHIHIGTDGVDGRTLVPLGVRSDEDGLYYWTVDGEWLLDAEGNKVRAGATDGTDGIVPQIKVEEGFWWISLDGGETYEKLADCADMDGYGVFSDVDATDPDKVVLTLWGGETLELPCYAPIRLSFDGPVRDTVLIAAGERLSIPYEVILQGETDLPLTVTTGTDGNYVSRLVEGDDPGKGVIKVQAPETFQEGYILLSAYCGGYSALKMITFREREVSPSEELIRVRLGSGTDTRVLDYQTNFPYSVHLDESWLEVVPDMEAGTLSFTSLPNESDKVRFCEVTITPADNPDYVCTTFRVIQATNSFTIELDEFSTLSFDPEELMILAPAAGGDADLWITFPVELTASVPEAATWLQAELADLDGFRRLRVHVDALEEGEDRGESILLQLKAGGIPILKIRVVQTGTGTGE